MPGSNRRDFFRLAASEAVRGARQVIPLVDPLMDLAETSPPPASQAPPPVGVQRTEPSGPTSRSASIDEMLAIAAELGLGPRAAELRRLAVSSVRLTQTTEVGGVSFAGGEPPIPATIEVPELEGRPARFVALLDLPEGGRRWVFRGDPGTVDPGPGGAGDTASSRPAALFETAADRASHGPIAPPPGAVSLHASPELVLPRPWSMVVAPLRLSRAEQETWQELRSRLAAVQGVPLGEKAPPHAAIHRIGGYPDERRGDMPLTCELRLLGVDLEGSPPATHPLAASLENEAGNWRLLAQLAADDDLGWSWGPKRRRLYVWGHLPDPGAAEYDSVQVIVQ